MGRVHGSIERLARATSSDGCALVAGALAEAGVVPSGARAAVLDSELALPSKVDRADEATLGVAYLLTAPAHAPLIVHGVATAVPPTTRPGPSAHCLRVDPLDLVLTPFPIDAALPWLSRLGGPADLDGIPDDTIAPGSLTDAVVRYRPGRRVILRFERACGTAVYAKVHAGGRDRDAAANLRAVVTAAPGFPAAALLAHGPATGTVWTAAASGVPMRDVLPAPDGAISARTAGRCLAASTGTSGSNRSSGPSACSRPCDRGGRSPRARSSRSHSVPTSDRPDPAYATACARADARDEPPRPSTHAVSRAAGCDVRDGRARAASPPA